MNQSENVKHQYSGGENLSARIKLHEKHSTNKKGFFPWLHEQYQFEENGSILELGCGNGMQWKGRMDALPQGSSLTLSDFAEGMIAAAKENLAPHPDNISFLQVDIQDILFAGQSFDTCIANFMLYHVPDLGKGLSEVRRVIKPDGQFYAATTSSGGMRQYLHDVIKIFEPGTSAFSQVIPFNMENGGEILGRHFASVKIHVYEDSLAVTDTNDLMDWLESSMSLSGYRKELFSDLYEYFEKIRAAEGAINIPKDVCLFVCTA